MDGRAEMKAMEMSFSRGLAKCVVTFACCRLIVRFSQRAGLQCRSDAVQVRTLQRPPAPTTDVFDLLRKLRHKQPDPGDASGTTASP